MPSTIVLNWHKTGLEFTLALSDDAGNAITEDPLEMTEVAPYRYEAEVSGIDDWATVNAIEGGKIRYVGGRVKLKDGYCLIDDPAAVDATSAVSDIADRQDEHDGRFDTLDQTMGDVSDDIAAVSGQISYATLTEYQIATAVWELAGKIDGKTPQQAIQYIAAICSGLIPEGAGSGTETFLGLDKATPRVSFTVDEDGNRTAVEYDPA